MKEDIKPLPPGHESYRHKFFPVGDNIPVVIKEARVIDVFNGEPALKLKLSYGPYIRYETISGASAKDIKDIRYKNAIKIVERTEGHIIKEKYIYTHYMCDDLFAIINLFSKIGVSSGTYPDKDPETDEEKLDTLRGLKGMFDEFFVTPRRQCYVDTELAWAHKVGGVVWAKSKIKVDEDIKMFR